MTAPLIAITVDVADPAASGEPPRPRAQAALTYTRSIALAGGIPILLPPLIDLIPQYLDRFDGFLFTGGDDPRTEPFGIPTHPKAAPLHPIRQEFEVALLRALDHPPREHTPVLGVCLGMQLMALCAGGSLNQHMPDDTPTADQHARNSIHRVHPLIAPPDITPHLRLPEGDVTSHHRQAVRTPGRLLALAAAPDGIVEAIADPARPFFLGVQWHPERTAAHDLGQGLITRFVEACRT